MNIDKEQYLILTDKQKLAVLKDGTNHTRLNAARIASGSLVHHTDMVDQALLELGTYFYRHLASRGWPAVLHCPEFVAAVDSEYRLQFTVAAGKIEYERNGDTSINWKYIESFPVLESAVDAMQACQGYPVIELTYVDAKGSTYEVILKEKVSA